MSDVVIKDFNLTGRERDILSILWNADKGMIASEIVKEREDLTINTVQAILKKLLKRNLIKVDEIVYSGTVLSRSYVPTLTEAEFQTRMIEHNIFGLKKFCISPAKFVMGFLGNANDEISAEEADELLAMLKEQREEKQGNSLYYTKDKVKGHGKCDLIFS